MTYKRTSLPWNKIEIAVYSVILKEEQDLEEHSNARDRNLGNLWKRKGISFINKDNIESSCLNRSNLHFNKKGTSFLMKNFVDCLKEDPIYKLLDWNAQNVINFYITLIQFGISLKVFLNSLELILIYFPCLKHNLTVFSLILNFCIQDFMKFFQAWTNSVHRVQFFGVQFYLRPQSGTKKTGAQNQSMGPMEKQLETLFPFVFYYLNRADGVYSQSFSIKSFL